MGTCPKCNQTVDDQLDSCPACGHLLKSNVTGTLNVEQHYAGKPSTESADHEIPASGSVDRVPSTGEGTLSAPEYATEKPAEGTPERTLVNSATESGDQQEAQPAEDENARTLQIDAASSTPVQGTHAYSPEELKEVQGSKGGSGTAGRLKRLWEGAAGSSANPMNTLKRDDALATDSVFEQVSHRVLAQDPMAKIAEALTRATGARAEIRERLQQCVAQACEGSNSATSDYDITDYLGRGAMGLVLKARQKSIGRDVAIKMIQPGGDGTKSSTSVQKKKFLYEAQITGMLDHPNIVPVYDLGICNEILFYSMKQIMGEEWQKTRAKKTRDENIDVFMKVADALAFSHQRGIIHRDLKPENVMIGEFGEVLVTDWGCAVDLNRNEPFGLAGSPAWMAPEMGVHEVSKIGSKSDIYLLGAILYWIISGHPPHPGNTLTDCLRAVADNKIIPIDSQDALVGIALKAMSTEPEERYATVELMQDAIREYQRHAESIKLTERSEVTLKHAVQSKDYEAFARSLFGYREAIDLWSNNKAAVEGLGEARLAYGQAAFDKSDFDLCLQTLSDEVPIERELRAKAAKSKQAILERETRFKTLRRGFIAILGLSIVGLSIFLAVVSSQRSKLQTANQELTDKQTLINKQNEDLTRSNETIQGQIATIQEQKDELQENYDNLEMARNDLQMKNSDLEMARNTIQSQFDDLEMKNRDLEAARDTIKGQFDELQTATSKIQLGNYQSKISLSQAQIGQYDVAASDKSLGIVDEVLTNSEAFKRGDQVFVPKLQNWAWRRVHLLGNQDLLSPESFGEGFSAMGFAGAANVGAIASFNANGGGEIAIVRLEGSQLSTSGQVLPTPSVVDSIALSPDGSEVIYSLHSANDESSVYAWRWQSNSAPQPVSQSNLREDGGVNFPTHGSLQRLIVSRNHVIGGIDSGIWIWDRTNPNWQASDPVRVKRIRGQLLSLQMLGDEHALVLSRLNDRHIVHLLQLESSDGLSNDIASLSFEASEENGFDPAELSAVAFGNGRLILGTITGRLFTIPFSTNRPMNELSQVGPEFREVLPRQHQSEVRTIHVHNDGTMLSTAFEPVVHVWAPDLDQESGWRYDTNLVGTKDNIGDVSFMVDSSLVLGIGEKGNSIVWDVERQKQRRRLVRTDEKGAEIRYQAPVLKTITGTDNRRTVSIDRNGMLDSWDVVTGQSLTSHGEMPPSFVGHSPNAVFSDMAVDAKSGTLVTSAHLPRLQDNSEAAWEFCKWDIETGKMLNRWTSNLDGRYSGRQISLLEGGKFIMYSSDRQPLAIINRTADNAQEVFSGNQLGSVLFASEHPQHSELALIAKANGTVGIYDSNRNDFVDVLDSQERDQLQADRDLALLGAWSPSGNRYYLCWASGGITEFSWQNNQLSIIRDIRGPEAIQLGLGLQFENSSQERQGSFRINSRWQSDLKVRESEGVNLVYRVVRFPGVEGRVRLTRIAFGNDARQPVAKSVEDTFPDIRVVLSDDDVPELKACPISRLPVGASDIVAVHTAGESTYFASTSGAVYRITGDGQLVSYGTPPVVSATGDVDAKRIVLLHEGGILSQADWTEDQWVWTQLPTTNSDATDVVLSPDGNQLLVSYGSPGIADRMVLTNKTTGEETAIADTKYGTLLSDGRLSIVKSDGTVVLRQAGQDLILGRLPADSDLQVRSIQLFNEAWSDDNSSSWLAVHAQNPADNRLHYFPLDIQVNQPPAPSSLVLAPEAHVVSCSPREGVLLVGTTSGNVTVYFASPTLEEVGNELFALEGHAGSDLLSIQFTPDGSNVVTTDVLNRQFTWMSEDSLDGITKQLGETGDVSYLTSK
ncbi:MAG: protein kinase [Planctomycetales bacterium]|nr:protein kinase [Planctomycetales bacterium]